MNEPHPGVSRVARRVRDYAADRLPGLTVATALVFLVVAAALAGFFVLARTVSGGHTDAFDAAVVSWLAERRVGWLDVVASQITALGNAATLAVVGLAAAAILWAADRKISVYLLLLSLLSGTLVTYTLKWVFSRPRPDVGFLSGTPMSASFPSGHAMMAAVTYGTVAYLVGRMAQGGVRLATWIGAAILVLLIGFSRMYVGAHFPTDVVAGWVVGAAWTSLLAVTFLVLDVFAREMPELHEAEPELPAPDRDA